MCLWKLNNNNDNKNSQIKMTNPKRISKPHEMRSGEVRILAPVF